MPSSSTASYTAATNQVASVNGGAGLVYDAAGDVTQDPLNSYLYDAEGRLCAAKTAGPSYTGYIYDASGIRVAKGSLTSFSCNFAANGFTPTASYVLGPGGEQVTEYAVSAGTSTWVHTNAFSGGKIQATYHDTGTYFYLGDWLGTKRVEVGASGCASGYTSLAYGDGLTTVALPGFTACASDATEHHFTGKERDNESGNDYFGARYYASSMGRFMSPDWSAQEEPVPYANLDDPQSLNLYSYVRNNPLTNVDADGHCGGPGEESCGSRYSTDDVTAIVFNEVGVYGDDSGEGGPSLQTVYGDLTHAIYNGESLPTQPANAGTDLPAGATDTSTYKSIKTSVDAACKDAKNGIDPTGGADNFNTRNTTSTADRQYRDKKGKLVATQPVIKDDGPYKKGNTKSKTRYSETFEKQSQIKLVPKPKHKTQKPPPRKKKTT
jgi:RHS repeat-associated protein